jgi:adenylate cyclase
MPERQLSAGIETAWQIAGDLALQCGSAAIEPIHILYGIAALDKRALHISTVDDPAKSAELQRDRLEVEQQLRSAGLDPKELRQRIREVLKPGGSSQTSISAQRLVSRSKETKTAFLHAIESAHSGELATPALLLHALLDLDDATVQRILSSDEIARLKFRNDQRSTIVLDEAVISSIDQNEMGESLDASIAIRPQSDGSTADKLISLCEITWQFGVGANLETFLQEILRELVRVLPTAERASILMLEEDATRLLLKAHIPSGTPVISLTSVSRALETKSAFIWKREENITASQQFGQIEAGIYAPLVANNEALGVICLDCTKSSRGFTHSDLSLVVALAHQLALAVANRRLHQKLQTNAQVLERLLTNFSPKIRKRLVERAQQGKLRLGGERSSVSILCSDIRGFTKLSAGMDAEDVVAMLNDYFLALTECIFRNDGTIDKFVGDAILAVFGSPDPDPQHHHNAVKAAMEMQAAMREVNERRSAKGLPICEIGVGVHTGDVLHGFIGSPERMEYTIIGDAVNRASRLCDGAGPTEVVISQEIHQYVWNFVSGAPASIPTKHEGVLQAYRVEKLRG